MKAVFAAVNARYSHSSLALRYLKSVNNELNIKIREYSINDAVFDIYSSLLAENADYYCFSCYIWNIDVTVRVAELLKKAKDRCKIILGGPEVSYNPEKYTFADHVICGEGEEAIGDILRGEVSDKVVQGRNFDLSKMPLPYDEEDIKSLKNRIIYFETSRGCPCKCTYCLSGDNTTVRYFPMEYVKKGFDLFFKEKVPLVKLIDRTFNADEARAEEIIKYIIDNSECTRVHLEIEPHFLNDNIITLLQSAPLDLFQLEIGIQTANKDTLRAIRRSADTVKMAENIRNLRLADNMHIHLDLIAGLPYEDLKSFKNSFNYVYGLRPHMLQLGFLKVMHGAPIEGQEGIRYASFAPYRVVATDWISAEELALLDRVEEAVDRFYNSGSFTRTLDKISGENPFELFLRLGDILSAKGAKVSRGELYNIMYEMYGDVAEEEILFDFLLNNKDMPLPSFAVRTPYDGLKRKIREFMENEDKRNKYGIGTDLKYLRFEPVFDQVYLTDYKSGGIFDITNEL